MFARFSKWWWGERAANEAVAVVPEKELAIMTSSTAIIDSTFSNQDQMLAGDIISHFRDELKAMEAKAQANIDKWRMIKEDQCVMGSDGIDPRAKGLQSGNSVKDKIKHIFSAIFASIKSAVQSIDMTMDATLTETKIHIDALHQHSEELCQQLHDINLTEEQKRRIRYDICDSSIAILNEITALTDSLDAEIETCLREAALGEKAALYLVEFLLHRFFPLVTLPDFDFKMARFYENYLVQHTKQARTGVEATVSTAEADLRHVETEVLASVEEKKMAARLNLAEIDRKLMPGMKELHKRRAQHYFHHTPHQNIRDAGEKLVAQPTLRKRTQSM